MEGGTVFSCIYHHAEFALDFIDAAGVPGSHFAICAKREFNARLDAQCHFFVTREVGDFFGVIWEVFIGY